MFARRGFTNLLGCVQDTEDNGEDISKGLEVDISTRQKARNSRPSQQPELASQDKTKVEEMTLLKNSDLLQLIAVISSMLAALGKKTLKIILVFRIVQNSVNVI